MYAGVKLAIGVLLCALPLKQLQLTSGFGWRVHPLSHRLRLHAGIDLAAHGDTAYAVLDGVVRECRFDPGLGLYVQVTHGGAVEKTYGHLSQWLGLPGDSISAGTPLGITGATGAVTGEHLHFAVKFQRHFIDPLRFLRMVMTANTNNSTNL